MDDSPTPPAPPQPQPLSKPPAGGVKTFSCPSCGGTVNIRAAGSSITAVCGSCGSIIDVANENYTIIAKAAVKVAKSLIPLGSRGVLLGTEWEVIGYSVLTDGSGEYSWREYLLFNPWQGFRFLVEMNHHWNFVRMLRSSIEGAGTSRKLSLDDRDYRIYEFGEAVVRYVMGEFFWRVKVGQKSQVADYIAPPYMLSMDKSGGDIVWSQARYMPPATIEQAFKITNLPAPQGIAPNQPGPYSATSQGILLVSLIALLLLLIVQGISVTRSANQTVYERSVYVTSQQSGQAVVADPIELPGDMANVKVWAQSYVSNNWLELNVSLVNEATQQTDEAVLPIEYYFGRDSDGSWTEGGYTASRIISAVPGGKYRLMVEPTAGAFSQYPPQPVSFDIRVIRDAPIWQNFWITLCLILAYPIWAALRYWNFETKRWSNSDYAPSGFRTSSGDSDDD